MLSKDCTSENQILNANKSPVETEMKTLQISFSCDSFRVPQYDSKNHSATAREAVVHFSKRMEQDMILSGRNEHTIVYSLAHTVLQ